MTAFYGTLRSPKAIKFYHGIIETVSVKSISPIRALDSNYFWVIHPDNTDPSVYIVDPGDAEPVITYLKEHQLQLSGILITHRHGDHINGIDALLERWPVKVYGPDSSWIPQVTHKLIHGDRLNLPMLALDVIAVPGHTSEHIAYFMPRSSAALQPEECTNQPALFCGDVLFGGGCGRLFDGPAEAMFDSLQTLAALPDDTQVYCAHEYTLSNLEFALEVEPSNTDLIERLAHVRNLHAAKKITLPSNILLEKRTNPFLRCQEIGVKNFVAQHVNCRIESTIDVFTALRLIKNTW